jgi:dCTP deaminase
MIINRNQLLIASPIKDMIPEKVKQNGVSFGLGEAGYDIRIKQEVTFDNREGRHLVFCDGSVTRGHFSLASAIEEFQMPTNLVGIVHDKSTWARQALSVFNTVIEPGWCGFLTLELAYHGSSLLTIPAGAGIAQVVFHQTSEHAQYEGKYQHQEDKPQEAKFDG